MSKDAVVNVDYGIESLKVGEGRALSRPQSQRFCNWLTIQPESQNFQTLKLINSQTVRPRSSPNGTMASK